MRLKGIEKILNLTGFNPLIGTFDAVKKNSQSIASSVAGVVKACFILIKMIYYSVTKQLTDSSQSLENGGGSTLRKSLGIPRMAKVSIPHYHIAYASDRYIPSHQWTSFAM